jgi:hypothetical protein
MTVGLVKGSTCVCLTPSSVKEARTSPPNSTVGRSINLQFDPTLLPLPLTNVPTFRPFDLSTFRPLTYFDPDKRVSEAHPFEPHSKRRSDRLESQTTHPTTYTMSQELTEMTEEAEKHYGEVCYPDPTGGMCANRIAGG